MPKLICQKCGDPFKNRNAKTPFCPECNPDSLKSKFEKLIEENDRDQARDQMFDGNAKKKFNVE